MTLSPADSGHSSDGLSGDPSGESCINFAMQDQDHLTVSAASVPPEDLTGKMEAEIGPIPPDPGVGMAIDQPRRVAGILLQRQLEDGGVLGLVRVFLALLFGVAGVLTVALPNGNVGAGVVMCALAVGASFRDEGLYVQLVATLSQWLPWNRSKADG